MSGEDVLTRLFAMVEERKQLRPEGSYVVSLLDGGLDAISAKIREEADELIEAGAEQDPGHVAHEAADLLFHVLVLLCHSDVSLDRVRAVLEARVGTGGLEEKAARTKNRENL